ncbi:MAG: NDP-hexose 4-ketoreductase, partial [Coriobacteriia bacterium]|nr:NDP-hexose 4-ketoreductase [Coriobacteriia bacterium]
LMVGRLRDQLVGRGMGIRLTPPARTALANEGFDPTLGARPLRRSIQRLLEDPLSEQILAGQWSEGDVIEVYLDEDAGVPAFRKGEGVAQVAAVASDSTGTAPSMPRRSSSRRGSGAASGGAAGE